MTVKERLIIYLKSKNISQAKFEQSIGASNGYINSMRKGLGIDKIEQVRITYPDLNIEWLRYGKGKMLNEDISESYTHIVGHGNLVKSSLSGSLSQTFSENEKGKVKYDSIDNQFIINFESLKKDNERLCVEIQHLNNEIKGLGKIVEEKERIIEEKEKNIMEKERFIQLLLASKKD